MGKRIALAALLAGTVLFAWEFVAHMFLPLGEAGIQALPNEQAVMTAIKDNVRQSGFYFFPSPVETSGMTSEQKQKAFQQAEEKARIGPLGIMIVRPDGGPMMMPSQLVTQFVVDVLVMLLLAILLAQMPAASFGKRMMQVAIIGLIPALVVDVPYWNWFSFPAAYTLAQIVMHVVGFVVGGLVLARMIDRPGHPA